MMSAMVAASLARRLSRGLARLIGGALASIAIAAVPMEVSAQADLWDQTALPREMQKGPLATPVIGRDGKERIVAMFYFTWLCESGETATRGPTDVSRVLASHPDAARDPFHAAWNDSHHGATSAGNGANQHYHHWGKPLFGYYCSADSWVIANHIRLLSDAGVDLLILDATNSVTYDTVVDKVIAGLAEIAAQGRVVPRIAFYTNTESGATMRKLYERFYAPTAKHRDPSRWFVLEGRPLMIGQIKEAPADLRAFFTLRESQWPNEATRDCGWPWIEFVRPQPVHRCHGRAEIINVSVAQHGETIKMSSLPFEGKDLNWGRGYHAGQRDHSQDAVYGGLNFQEQWDHAIAADPPFVFVTGWNEWIGVRLYDGKQHFMVDLATPEFSRDIEMMDGGWGDAYYLQLLQNIRRYKGVPRPVAAHCGVTIDIAAGFEQWQRVAPTFRDYVGDTRPRDAVGIGGGIRLTDRSGRNDIDRMKVACDTDNFYFYVSTVEALSPRNAERWMQLYIGVDNDGRSGELNFQVNRYAPLSQRDARIQKRDGAGAWSALREPASYRAAGRELHIAVPRQALGAGAGTRAIHFKWADHSAPEPDGMSLYKQGDTAPGGRLAYRFVLEGSKLESKQ